MPIYEFVCESCGHIVERLQKLTDPPPAACPECGAKMAKIMSRNSFQLKGGGWYSDLYSSAPSNSAKPGGEKSSSAASPAPASSAASTAPAASAPASSPSASASTSQSSASAPPASGKSDA
jgi:putative FmdB family regulatory protein